MSENITVARPYAKAAFDFAVENNCLNQWSTMLQFASIASENEQLRELIFSDSKPQKVADVFIAICEGQLDEFGQNFIRILAENRRLMLLPAIFSVFSDYKALRESMVDVDVISADELSSMQKEKISQAMEKRLSRKVKLNCKIDKSVMAGVIIRSGNLVIDGSIRARLERLADTLQS